jgi:hypothetical protein
LKNFGNRKEVKKCQMDMVEDLEEGDGDSVSEEALPRGLMLGWGEEDCRDADIFSVELQECLPRRVILLMIALRLRLIMVEWLIQELCHMVMPVHLWEQLPMLRR